MAEILDYKDDVSATLQPTCCPTCGQECHTPIVRGNVWHGLATFAAKAVAEGQPGNVDVRKLLEMQEKLLPKEERLALGRRSTYRVSKGILAQAVDLGIPLLQPNGKVKGKTALYEEIIARRLRLRDEQRREVGKNLSQITLGLH
jgi:hypothetical protein